METYSFLGFGSKGKKSLKQKFKDKYGKGWRKYWHAYRKNTLKAQNKDWRKILKEEYKNDPELSTRNIDAEGEDDELDNLPSDDDINSMDDKTKKILVTTGLIFGGLLVVGTIIIVAVKMSKSKKK